MQNELVFLFIRTMFNYTMCPALTDEFKHGGTRHAARALTSQTEGQP